MELMRFLPEGWNHSKIQVWFKLEFTSEFYDSNSRGNLKFGQKGDLFQLKLSITWLTLENFEQPKDHIFCIFKLEQSNYWKIFGILEKGFNGPARLHSAVRCRFELTAYKAPECRASVHHPDHAHLCVLLAVILIRSARVSSKPRYFPHFASRRALCTARCCSSNERHRPKLRHRRVGPHPLATMHRAVDRSAAPSAFPHQAELERAARLYSLSSLRPVSHRLSIVEPPSICAREPLLCGAPPWAAAFQKKPW
jgi:hypothetical protein